MTYPQYIVDEVCRRLSHELEKAGLTSPDVNFNPRLASHRAFAEFLLEQDFKAPLDPLIEEVFEVALFVREFAAGSEEEVLEAFAKQLASRGLTIRLTIKQ